MRPRFKPGDLVRLKPASYWNKHNPYWRLQSFATGTELRMCPYFMLQHIWEVLNANQTGLGVFRNLQLNAKIDADTSHFVYYNV